MRHRTLPGTDLQLSEISFGAGTAGGLMVHGSAQDQDRAVAVACDLGINHFDTAPVYGYGASEVNLGRALNGRSDVIVTSKVAFGAEILAGVPVKHAVMQSVEASLSRLHRDHLDFLLVHNSCYSERKPANPVMPGVSVDDILGPEGARGAVDELRRQGKVRYFGFSSQRNDTAAARAVLGSGEVQLITQNYSLLNPSAGTPPISAGRRLSGLFGPDRPADERFDDIIGFAHLVGAGVSVISPLAAGALSEAALSGVPAPEVSERARRFPRAGQYESEIERARVFKLVAEKAEMSIEELAYRRILATPGVTTVIGGFSNEEQLRQAASFGDGVQLPPDVFDAIDDIWYGTQGETHDFN